MVETDFWDVLLKITILFFTVGVSEIGPLFNSPLRAPKSEERFHTSSMRSCRMILQFSVVLSYRSLIDDFKWCYRANQRDDKEKEENG